MSEEQEIAMGQQADPQVIAQFGLYEDSSLQQFIREKGQAMAAISHRPNIAYTFRVIDSEVLNAFAVPGGYVYFTRGIMAHFNNEAEFAGVLGHEIGHITARHSVIQQRNQMLSQLGLIAGIIINPDLAPFAEAASQGLGLMMLKFGRDDERESDKLGAEYSSKIGYDAQEMADFFQTLERIRVESGTEELPNFLSTHPNPGDRYTAVTQHANEWKKNLNLTNPQINRETYLRKIEGLIYGEDPKGGYLENNVFYHPVLKFQFSTPQGWAYQNSPTRVQLAPKDGKALFFFTLAPGNSLQEASNTILQQNNLQLVNSREINVNGFRAIEFTADVRPQQGQPQNQPVIRTLNLVVQQDQTIYHMLGASTQQDFNTYGNYFYTIMQSFRQLTDPAKLNKKPMRVRIKTVGQNSSLQQVLQQYNITGAKLEEHAILNGMKLTDQVTRGTLIKVIQE